MIKISDCTKSYFELYDVQIIRLPLPGKQKLLCRIRFRRLEIVLFAIIAQIGKKEKTEKVKIF